MNAVDTITLNFASWLSESGLLPLLRLGFAIEALPVDLAHVAAVNHEVRSIVTDWLPGTTSWPDDHWVIGQDGAGNYFTVLRNNPRAVHLYDHECRRIEVFKPSVREYFDYCVEIERKNREEAA